MYRMPLIYPNTIRLPSPDDGEIIQNIILPEDSPYYLVSVVSMILRDGIGEDNVVKRIIQKDPLLRKVLFDENDQYHHLLVIIIARFLQERYGHEFIGLGPYTKQGVGDEGMFLDFKNNEDTIRKAIALIWNYSPYVNGDGELLIERDTPK